MEAGLTPELWALHLHIQTLKFLALNHRQGLL